jgi:hypothetical protein
MGYRTRLGKIAKTERQKVIGKSADQIRQMYEGREDSPYYPKEHTQLHELGKYVEYSSDHNFEQYYSFDIQEEFESEFHILTKEDLEFIINDYHKRIHQNYSFYEKVFKGEVLTEEEKERFGIYFEDEDNKEAKRRVSEFFRDRVREWGDGPFKLKPYSLDKEQDLIQSWQYEYAIFQLVEIYRNFDWENDYLIYSAW